MKINLSTVITDLSGEAVKDGEKDLTLSTVCISALLMPDQQDQPAKEKVERFHLAEKVHAAGEQDLSVDDVALLKKLIGKLFPPLVVGRAFAVLDPPPPKAVKESA